MDKEYIERKDVLKELNRNSITKKITLADGVSIYDTIKNIPTTDVVEVVRCKNCKHFITDTFKRTMCNRTFTMFEMNENDFCSYGERKEGAEE